MKISIYSILLVLLLHSLTQSTEVSSRRLAKRSEEDEDDFSDIDYSNYEDYYENYEVDYEASGEEMSDAELFGKGLASITNFASNLHNIDNIKKISKMALTKIGAALSKMGGAFKALGFLTTALSGLIGNPDPESKELKFMKDKFSEVDGKLDVIENKMNDIQNAIEYQGAKMSFGKYVRKIKTMKRHLKVVIDSKDKQKIIQNRDIFMESFINNYDDSAIVLYDALMGIDQTYFGYDILVETSKKFKCNIHTMTEMCVLSGKILSDALEVEGAYLGFRNMTWRLKDEGNQWRKRMKKFGERCQEMMNKCADDWRKYAEPMFQNIYAKKRGSSNKEMADELFNQLSANLPQRAWAVFVYKDVGGFGPHTVTKNNNDAFMKWHEAGKCVTVVSADVRRSKFDEKQAKLVMDKANHDINDCNANPPKDPALRLVKSMQRHYGYWPGGCMYALKKGIDLEKRFTEGHWVSRKVKGTQYCDNGSTKYDHELYVFN